MKPSKPDPLIARIQMLRRQEERNEARRQGRAGSDLAEIVNEAVEASLRCEKYIHPGDTQPAWLRRFST